jgi:hypothetical protein
MNYVQKKGFRPNPYHNLHYKALVDNNKLYNEIHHNLIRKYILEMFSFKSALVDTMWEEGSYSSKERM